jgi:PAS domain S-box-containing protein
MEGSSTRPRDDALVTTSEERFLSFVEGASVGIYRSTPAGKIVMVNRALLKMLGLDSFEKLAGQDLEKDAYAPGYSRKEFKEKIEREGSIRGLEAEWLRADGTAVAIRESASVVRAPDGTVLYYDGIVEDISERKRAERDLRESEERFRILTQAAFEGIFITEDGRIRDVNDQGLRMFGYERSEMIGLEVISLVSPEHRSLVDSAIRGGIEKTYEHRMVRKDGSTFYAEAKAKMMHAGTRTLRMTALHDITEAKKAEQQRQALEGQLRQSQKMEALGTLAGGIAHDFNNILTGIMGHLQLAQMDLAEGHPALSSMMEAEKASRRARDLVARILSFSRLERADRQVTPLGPVVLEAVELLRASLPSKIEIRTDIDAECPHVRCDAAQVHQVIVNLGTNAAHAMEDANGVLTVELRAAEPGRELMERHPQVRAAQTVRLAIRDTGCGMDDAVQKRIFEPFFTTKAFGKGTGLGLAVVHAIIQNHSGSIVVESAVGRGSEFSIYFPGVSSKEAGPAPGSAAVPHELAPFGRGRAVLLVDDEPAVRSFGGDALRRLGFRPTVLAHPVMALEAFRLTPSLFSAIISDLTMPDMTGLELARQVRGSRPDIPFILATGFLNADATDRAADSGVRSVLTKPFEIHELAARLRAALQEPEAGPQAPP